MWGRGEKERMRASERDFKELLHTVAEVGKSKSSGYTSRLETRGRVGVAAQVQFKGSLLAQFLPAQGMSVFSMKAHLCYGG